MKYLIKTIVIYTLSLYLSLAFLVIVCDIVTLWYSGNHLLTTADFMWIIVTTLIGLIGIAVLDGEYSEE